jgi:hypothetical protein
MGLLPIAFAAEGLNYLRKLKGGPLPRQQEVMSGHR